MPWRSRCAAKGSKRSSFKILNNKAVYLPFSLREYLLFLDTETSGRPKDWTLPYDAEGNWPHIVQLAWAVYTRAGEEVKAESHYIKAEDYVISADSEKVHGIGQAFLDLHGKARPEVMELLRDDLLHFQPLVISHFAQLDFHMAGLGFYRTGIENPLPDLPSFCTMLVTKHYISYPDQKLLRLGELYQRLFNTPLADQHNALNDAKATAKCFFELWRKGDIDEKTIEKQQYQLKKWSSRMNRKRTWWPWLLLTIVILLLLFWLL